MSEVTIQLTKPITAHDKEVSDLTLREPTAGDVMECGYPLGMDGELAIPQAAPIGRPHRSSGRHPAIVRQATLHAGLQRRHGGRARFFRRLGRSGSGLTDLAFELAFFWKVSPNETLSLPLSSLLAWERQAERINKELNDGG